MKKNYQTTTRRARNGRTTPKKARLGADQAAHEAALSLPESVTIAIADLADQLEEGLLAFAVGTGLKVLDVILGQEATALAEPRGRHDPGRRAVRHGTDDGLVVITWAGARSPSAAPGCAAPIALARWSCPPTRRVARPRCWDA